MMSAFYFRYCPHGRLLPKNVRFSMRKVRKEVFYG